MRVTPQGVPKIRPVPRLSPLKHTRGFIVIILLLIYPYAN